jgi:hypothetical protein
VVNCKGNRLSEKRFYLLVTFMAKQVPTNTANCTHLQTDEPKEDGCYIGVTQFEHSARSHQHQPSLQQPNHHPPPCILPNQTQGLLPQEPHLLIDKSTQQGSTYHIILSSKVQKQNRTVLSGQTHQTPTTLSSSQLRTVMLYHPPETLVHTNTHPIPIMQSAPSPIDINSAQKEIGKSNPCFHHFSLNSEALVHTGRQARMLRRLARATEREQHEARKLSDRASTVKLRGKQEHFLPPPPPLVVEESTLARDDMQPRRRGKRIQHPVTGAASSATTATALALALALPVPFRFPSFSPRRFPSCCLLPISSLGTGSLPTEPNTHPQAAASPHSESRDRPSLVSAA